MVSKMPGREHHRVRLRLPVRLRWITPFGQRSEICESMNVSRGGLLVSCKEPHAPGAALWATFPYDASMPNGQPEVPARVLRSEAGPNVPMTSHVAIRFERARQAISNGNGHVPDLERRASPRRTLAMPVHVRPERVPWFEDAMTLDVSIEGLRFVSSREYALSDRLLLSFDPFASAPWHCGAEIPARIVRVERLPESSALAVTVQRLP
ncbi:MAG TPA: PilZ domain-containing protein [Candidatus Limnocylindria bacterium]|nr:PilZ domain-containing protein [Candidatus Limnocylindria bacterium]